MINEGKGQLLRRLTLQIIGILGDLRQSLLVETQQIFGNIWRMQRLYRFVFWNIKQTPPYLATFWVFNFCHRESTNVDKMSVCFHCFIVVVGTSQKGSVLTSQFRVKTFNNAIHSDLPTTGRTVYQLVISCLCEPPSIDCWPADRVTQVRAYLYYHNAAAPTREKIGSERSRRSDDYVRYPE